jgi:flagellar biosynthesis/type III secretory pathway protein FliH
LDDRFQKGVKQGKEEGMAEGMKQGKDKLQEYTSITPYS